MLDVEYESDEEESNALVALMMQYPIDEVETFLADELALESSNASVAGSENDWYDSSGGWHVPVTESVQAPRHVFAGDAVSLDEYIRQFMDEEATLLPAGGE